MDKHGYDGVVVERCPKCNGTGWRKCDHNNMKVCEACCKHDKGWLELSPMHYGYKEGADNACCKAGCGTLRRDISTPNQKAHTSQSDSVRPVVRK